jgi:hypothetical protein
LERDYAKEHEVALAQGEQERKQTAKVYSIREASRRSSEIVTERDSVLGEIRFGVLNISEFTALNLDAVSDGTAKLRKVMWAMFQKADPELTLEQFEKVPADDFTILTAILGRYLPGFLRLGKQILNAGSIATP